MKVCTDSCVLGAWAGVGSAKRILDIGAGTGLLSLMLAQRNKMACIEAVELDPAAATQAQENFNTSPWAQRLFLHPTSLQAFQKTNPTPFDAIISNPPFFQDSLKSADAVKNQAKHTGTLSFTEIVSFARQHLTATGTLHILLPPHEAKVFEQVAAAGFFTSKILWLEATPDGKLLRAIHSYSRQESALEERRLAVREKDGTYTAAFRELLRDFYLIF